MKQLPIKLHRSTLNVTARSDEGVERSGDGKAPTAFRIWRAGENRCDDGSIFFTEKSASKLLAEQESRGRVMSIDFDHLSLAEDRPAEAGRAAGWHRLETRDSDSGPELWAVDVEWSPDVKSGLEEEPPRWRFFSPAFYADTETQEVTSYINLALCINPMTHGIPLLASRKLTQETPMPTAEEMLAALDAMIEATTDENQKAALVAAREALASKKDVDSDAPADSPAETDSANTHAEGADVEKKDDDKKETAVKTHTVKSSASSDPIAALTAQVMQLTRNAEVAAINEILSESGKLPEEFKAHCRTKSLADAKVMISTVVGATKTHAARGKSPSQGSTMGSSELDPREADYVDRGMGITSNTTRMPEKISDGRFVMHTVRPSDLARLNAQKGKA